MQIGEARAGQRSGGGVEQIRKPNELHSQRRQHEQRGRESREVQPRRPLDRDASPDRGDVATQHVQHDGCDQRHDGQKGQQTNHARDNRHREHVVGDIAPEDGIDRVERSAMHEAKHVEPRARGAETHQHRDTECRRPRHTPHELCQLDGADRSLDHPRHQVDAAQRDTEVPIQEHERSGADTQAEQRTRDDLCREDALVAERLEPHPIGGEPDQRRHEEEEE